MKIGNLCFWHFFCFFNCENDNTPKNPHRFCTHYLDRNLPSCSLHDQLQRWKWWNHNQHLRYNYHIDSTL